MPARIEVSDLFNTVQGEGPLTGTPSTFLRLRRCNLACTWCDTKYTWDPNTVGFEHFTTYVGAESLAFKIVEDAAKGVSWDMRAKWFSEYDKLLPASIENLVITGGEPMIWHRQINEVLQRLATSETNPIRVVEFETNGTIIPEFSPEVYRDFTIRYNVSPKLPSSDNFGRNVIKPDVLEFFAQYDHSYFKFVIQNELDAEAFNQVSNIFGRYVPPDRVFLMPEGTTEGDLWRHEDRVRELANYHGIQFTDRAHIHAFGGGRGV